MVKRKTFFSRVRATITLVAFFLSLVFGVLGLATLTVDKMFDTEWVWNDDYNPNATPEYGEVCGYSYAEGEKCETAVLNDSEFAKGYYFSYSEWGVYGYGEHTSFLGNDVPTSPSLFFIVFYGVLVGFGAKRFITANTLNRELDKVFGE